MQFSPQQTAVFDWVRSGRGSAFVEAVAGAGKTTTIVEACRLMRGSVAFAAYNKKIATEIEEKVAQHGLGTNVRVGTFHRFGYVSHIEAHESAPEGIVGSLHEDDLVGAGLCPADAVLCRLTAPLVKLAFKLIKAGIGCHVEGRDIGAGLLKLATRWSRVKSVTALRERLEEYVEREVEKLTAKGQETKAEAVQDRVDTLLALLDGCKTLDDLTAKITELFTSDEDGHQNTLTLSTVHKSKGREWDRVFVLGFSKFMPSRFARQAWQLEQENNLIYVAFTRAKRELVLVDVEAKAAQPAEPSGGAAGTQALSTAA